MNKMKELYEKVAGDSVLRGKFTEIMKNSDAASTDEIRIKLLEFAKEAGYNIDYEEMQTFFSDLAVQQNGELSDAELDSVAGGKNFGEIRHSIVSLGTYCATLSAVTAIKGEDCGARFS